jgi:hypothetical protein
MEQEPKEIGDKRNADGTFAVGNSGGPGRPKGSVSIIQRIKQKFEEDPELFEKYVDGVMMDEKLRGQLINHIDGAPKERKEVEVKLPQFVVDLIKDEYTQGESTTIQGEDTD